jgi:hypothetical protein
VPELIDAGLMVHSLGSSTIWLCEYICSMVRSIHKRPFT